MTKEIIPTKQIQLIEGGIRGSRARGDLKPIAQALDMRDGEGGEDPQRPRGFKRPVLAEGETVDEVVEELKNKGIINL